MDLSNSKVLARGCLKSFRVADLQEALRRLGRKTTGRKQDLTDELQLALYSPDAAVADAAVNVVLQVAGKHPAQAAAQYTPPAAAAAYAHQQQMQQQQQYGKQGMRTGTGLPYPPAPPPYVGQQQQQAAQRMAAAAPAVHNGAAEYARLYGAGPASTSAAVKPAVAGAGAIMRPATLPGVAPLPPPPGSRIRCICNQNDHRHGLEFVQCEEKNCGVYQHAACMGVRPGDKGRHKCEQCRLTWSDPFWRASSQFFVFKLRPKHPAQPSLQGMYRDVNISRDQFEALTRTQKDRLQLQLCCICLSDSVPNRMQWPTKVDLKVNGQPYRCYTRLPQNTLGEKGRDAPANLGAILREGQPLRISIECDDTRQFVLICQIAEAASPEFVSSLLLPPEAPAAAVARVLQKTAGATGDDDDIVCDSVKVSLMCELTGARVKKPGRVLECRGLGVFELDAFLQTSRQTRKWQCPHCQVNTDVRHVGPDTYLQRIVDSLAADESVKRIEIDSQGRWRPDGWEGAEWFSVEQGPTPEQLRRGKEGGQRVVAIDDEPKPTARTAPMVSVADSPVPLSQAAAAPASQKELTIDLTGDSDEEDAPLAKRQRTLAAFRGAASAPPAPRPQQPAAPARPHQGASGAAGGAGGASESDSGWSTPPPLMARVAGNGRVSFGAAQQPPAAGLPPGHAPGQAPARPGGLPVSGQSNEAIPPEMVAYLSSLLGAEGAARVGAAQRPGGAGNGPAPGPYPGPPPAAPAAQSQQNQRPPPTYQAPGQVALPPPPAARPQLPGPPAQGPAGGRPIYPPGHSGSAAPQQQPQPHHAPQPGQYGQPRPAQAQGAPVQQYQQAGDYRTQFQGAGGGNPYGSFQPPHARMGRLRLHHARQLMESMMESGVSTGDRSSSKLPSNGDGKITIDEFIAALKELGKYSTDAAAQEIFNKHDTDGDQHIDAAEFEKLWASLQ